MPTKQIELKDIETLEEVQAREKLNGGALKDYKEKMSGGTDFPAIDVFSIDSAPYILADGFHRVEAARQAGLTSIKANVRKGGIDEAILFSIGANSTHGIRRTNNDKRKAVIMLFQLLEKLGEDWSDRRIAEQCAVSAPYVGKVRKKLTENGFQSISSRQGMDGRKIETREIGRKKKTKKAPCISSHKGSTGAKEEDQLEDFPKDPKELFRIIRKHCDALYRVVDFSEDNIDIFIQKPPGPKTRKRFEETVEKVSGILESLDAIQKEFG